MKILQATNFEFRYRFWLIGLFFAACFSFYAIDHQNAVDALTHALMGDNVDGRTRRHVVQMFFGLAALILIVAAILRTWATAYLRSDVVHDLKLHAESLVADGPYRHTRNPLYLGSLLMTIGMGALASRIGWPLMALGMLIYGYRLIAREESELAATQGESFRAYCNAVPRLWPALRPCVPAGQRQPRWGQALLGEGIFWLFGIGLLLFAITLNSRFIFICNWSALAIYTIGIAIWKRRARQS